MRSLVGAALALVLAGCGGGGEPEVDARLELGRRVFTEISRPTCTTCHTLADAGAAGMVGPNLDQLKPDTLRVAAAVTNGLGIMPAQGDHLTPEQIQAVAHYVARVAGTAP